jgi:hypothetical protein
MHWFYLIGPIFFFFKARECIIWTSPTLFLITPHTPYFLAPLEKKAFLNYLLIKPFFFSLQKTCNTSPTDRQLCCPITARASTVDGGHRTVGTTDMFLQCVRTLTSDIGTANTLSQVVNSDWQISVSCEALVLDGVLLPVKRSNESRTVCRRSACGCERV